MQRYEKYKESGVDWIGEIPEHWKVVKLKYLGKAIIGLTYSPNDLCSEKEGTLVLRSSNLLNGRFVYGEKENSYVSSTIPEKLKIKKNDILICSRNGSRDLIGKCAIATENDEGYSFGAFTTVFRSDLNHYLFKILNSNIFKNLSGSFLTSTINQLTIGNLNSISVPIPSPSEQQTIATFLDDKTAKIDQTIAIKEKEIELLKERRQILIQKAVTKGLDDTVTLKDSGVDWIGEIPEHWEVRKLKYVLTMRNEKIESKSTDKVYVGMENIESQTGKYLQTDSQVEGLANVFYKDDILFGKLRPYLAKVYFSEFDGICSTEFLVYKSTNASFYQRVLLSDVFIKLVDSSTYGAKMPRASADFINNISIPTPPNQEQTQIVSYLEVIEEKIAKAILLKQQEIEKLKEYKTVLIDNVVTGKVRVS